jgi:hypothetical protein
VIAKPVLDGIGASTSVNPTEPSPQLAGNIKLGRVDEFWRNDVFGIPELNQT